MSFAVSKTYSSKLGGNQALLFSRLQQQQVQRSEEKFDDEEPSSKPRSSVNTQSKSAISHFVKGVTINLSGGSANKISTTSSIERDMY